MVNVIKYSVTVTLVVCAVAVSVTNADVHHVRSKRTIGYLFRSFVNTLVPTTEKPAALPTAQPLKIIPAPAVTTVESPTSVYKKKNYSPSMPAPDSEVIKPPIRPLAFPAGAVSVVSSPAPPVTAYYYQIFPSRPAGAGDDGGIANSKSENYVRLPEKPSRPTDRAPIKAQLIIFPFSTANTGNENVKNDKNYNNNNNNNDDNDNERITITRLPLEKRKPIEKPPYKYRAEIFVHPHETSGSQTPQDSEDDYRFYVSKENVAPNKKKWLEVGDLLNPSQKRSSNNNGDNNVEITKEKMVKICTVDEHKPLTYNKQEKPGVANKDAEYVKKPTRHRGKEDRTGGGDGDDDDDDKRDEDDDDREEEKPDTKYEEKDAEDEHDVRGESGGGRGKEIKRGKYRPAEADDGRFDYYRQNTPDADYGRIVGDLYVNIPHSNSRGGYDFSVGHNPNNYGQITNGPFSMDRSFPVSHQKMDQFLPNTIYQNPFLAPQNAQHNSNTYFPYNGANNFGNHDNGRANSQNPTSNFFPQLNFNLHDFPTTVPYTDDRYRGTTDRSFTYGNTGYQYNTNQNNQDNSGNEKYNGHDTDNNDDENNGNKEEDDEENEESDDENNNNNYNNDGSDDDEEDEDDDERSRSEKGDDDSEDNDKNEESTTIQRHAEPPRLPTSLHEEVLRKEGRQLQYIQHPPVFDMSADKSQHTTICFNMFGQRILCS